MFPRRREFLFGLAALGLGSLAAPAAQAAARSGSLVVVGGGFGGATVARFAKRLLPELQVTLVEASPRYVACPFSNLVVAGLRQITEQTFDWQALEREGIRVISDKAISVDVDGRSVALASSASENYDRLVLSPGIDFRWGALEGYDRGASARMPHAWKAGPQTLLLRDQLAAMPDDGTVLMSVPRAPFRCPPGPYERSSLIGAYLKWHKPRAKLLVLDGNDSFSKEGLFKDAWSSLYGEQVEWVGSADGGEVVRVDADAMVLHTDFDAIPGDVINVIPPQQAGAIARAAGVVDGSGWCPINAIDFSSTLRDNIHVIGDATIAAPMPKSAFSANAQAKVCAIQIARHFAGLEPEPTTLANTCYSYITEDQAISVSGVYRNDDGVFSSVPGAGGVSPLEGAEALRLKEGRHAAAWFDALTSEAFLS